MSALQRPRYPVPFDVERGLMDACVARSECQRNDSIGGQNA